MPVPRSHDTQQTHTSAAKLHDGFIALQKLHTGQLPAIPTDGAYILL